jgi:hypothetical protein
VADGLAAGTVGTEDVAEERPQSDSGGPQGAAEAAKADRVLGEPLLGLLGLKLSGSGKVSPQRKGAQAFVNWKAWGGIGENDMGSLPC